MGITIDESRQLLSQYQKLFNSLNGDYKLSQVQVSELSHSIGNAIETMRKYQKIVDIVSLNDEEFKQCGLKELKEILEVIADGNKNNHHASNC